MATKGWTLSTVELEPLAMVTVCVVLPPVARTSLVPAVVCPIVLSTVIEE